MEAEEKKKTFGSKLFNFLAMGGFMIVIVLGAALLIFFSWLTGK